MNDKHLKSLESFLKIRDFEIPGIQLDGEIHRFDAKKPNTGWYLGGLHEGTAGGIHTWAVVGDWTDEEKYYFKSSDKMSRQDSSDIKVLMEKAIEKAEIDRRKRHEQISIEATKLWKSAEKDGPPHPYLQKKKISLSGARFTDEKTMIIPCQDVYGKVWGAQLIAEDGKKRFLKGQRTKGTLFIIGDLSEAKEVYLCEGFSTGAAINRISEKPVVCSFNASNLPIVARALKEKYKTLKIFVCGDDDVFNEKNTGRENAEKAAKFVKSAPIFPFFSDLSTKPTDFNDLFCLEGEETVKNQLKDGSRGAEGFTSLGVSGATHIFLEHSNNELLKASNLNSDIMFRLVPREILAGMFPSNNKKEPDSFNHEQAKNFFISRF